MGLLSLLATQRRFSLVS